MAKLIICPSFPSQVGGKKHTQTHTCTHTYILCKNNLGGPPDQRIPKFLSINIKLPKLGKKFRSSERLEKGENGREQESNPKTVQSGKVSLL